MSDRQCVGGTQVAKEVISETMDSEAGQSHYPFLIPSFFFFVFRSCDFVDRSSFLGPGERSTK